MPLVLVVDCLAPTSILLSHAAHQPCVQPPQAPIVRRGSLLVTNAGTMNVNDFKTGVTIEMDGVPYRVLGMPRSHYFVCWQQWWCGVATGSQPSTHLMSLHSSCVHAASDVPHI